MTKPYVDTKINSNSFVRIFNYDIECDELVWHRDAKDRKIEIKECNGWALQMENSMPIEMLSGETYFITKNSYHRVIKGFGDLVVKITEYDE